MKILKRTLLFSLLSLFSLSSFAQPNPSTNYFEVVKNLEIFTDVFRQIDQLYVEDAAPGNLVNTALSGMLASLDPYTIYYPESRIEDAMYLQTGRYGGVGARVDLVSGKNTVLEVFESFPAYKSGLRAGDIITHINGKSIDGIDLDNLEDGLTGTPGSVVNLTVVQLGKPNPTELAVTRESIKTPDVPHFQLLENNVGYIKLDEFTQTASEDVKTSFNTLKEKGMNKLILDLRGNGGGLLNEAVKIVNFFVPKGTEITRTMGKTESWKQIYVAQYDPIDLTMPLVVLVDEMSASASEIVSGSLQDLDRAVIVGVPSFGKGLVQQTLDLSYNAKMKVTVAKYYTPSGRCIQKLDYGNKKDGRATQIDTTKIRTFYTTHGRPVKDGSGVYPDVVMSASASREILAQLQKNFAYFRFGVEFKKTHASIDSAGSFKLSQSDYNEFVQYAKKNAKDFVPSWFEHVEKLEKELASQTAVNAALKDQLNNLHNGISTALESTLSQLQSEITPKLEAKIVEMYYFRSAAIKQSLTNDPLITASQDVFQKSYSTILAGPAADSEKK
jgi:carboxyl-terminal processing protease